MFGFFKRRHCLDHFVAGAALGVAFERLRLDAPAAAYLFARALVNSKPLLDDETQPLPEKIAAMDAEIAQLKATRGDRADGGISILAIRFMQTLLTTKKRDVVSSYGYLMNFSDIAKQGERYRELETRDRLPPSNDSSRAILAKGGHACVADVIDAIVAECREKGFDVSTANEDVQTILALYDLR